MGRTGRVVVINSSVDDVILYERRANSQNSRIVVPANDSTLIKDVRFLTRRSKNELATNSELGTTEHRARPYRGPSSLCWNFTHSHINHIDVEDSAIIQTDLTGPLFVLGSLVSIAADENNYYKIPMPSVAVVSSNIGEYTVDVLSVISTASGSTVTEVLVQDKVLSVTFEQPHADTPLSIAGSGVSTPLSLVNGTSAVHIWTLEPVPADMVGAPVTSIAATSGLISAASTATGSVSFEPPALSDSQAGLYYLTIAKSAATPVNILKSHLVTVDESTI